MFRATGGPLKGLGAAKRKQKCTPTPGRLGPVLRINCNDALVCGRLFFTSYENPARTGPCWWPPANPWRI